MNRNDEKDDDMLAKLEALAQCGGNHAPNEEEQARIKALTEKTAREVGPNAAALGGLYGTVRSGIGVLCGTAAKVIGPRNAAFVADETFKAFAELCAITIKNMAESPEEAMTLAKGMRRFVDTLDELADTVAAERRADAAEQRGEGKAEADNVISMAAARAKKKGGPTIH